MAPSTNTSSKSAKAKARTKTTSRTQPVKVELPRQTDGLLVLPKSPYRVYSETPQRTAYVIRMCNALVKESRELRVRLAEQEAEADKAAKAADHKYKELLEDIQTQLLKRVKAAERTTEFYRTANAVRRQLQNASRPEGVCDEQPEQAVNNGLRFRYIIGELLFTHELFPYHAALHVTSLEGARVRLRNIKLELNMRTGHLTPASYMLVQQLHRHVIPAQHAANKTFMDPEVFNSIYDEEQPDKEGFIDTAVATVRRLVKSSPVFIELVRMGTPIGDADSEAPNNGERQ